MQHIGIVEAIHRYPVKSFQGESLQVTALTAAGLPGDRTHVFLNQSRHAAHVSAKLRPQLLAYSASYKGADPSADSLAITSPDGSVYGWDERLLDEVGRATGLDLAMKSFGSEFDGLAAVDAEPVLLSTKQSLQLLERRFGKQLGASRFRPNFILDAYDSNEPFENGWVGRTLRVGTAELYITERCERCSMVTVQPDGSNLDIDRTVLKFIVDECEGTYGVYARVRTTGSVALGDSVTLLS